MIKYTVGWLLIFESAFFLVPILTGLVYHEWQSVLSFLATALLTLAVGLLFILLLKPKEKKMYQKEGLVICALSWIVLSAFGAIPFVLSGATNSYIDALFETISGFTTTGASIFSTVEQLSHAVLIWRSFTHWLGGMGVLVFILAILPLGGGQSMHIMRAESPGPTVSKLVPKVKTTALILYSIYFGLTVAMFVSLLLAGENVFEAVNIAFSTAGTGGFAIHSDSLGSASNATLIIVTVFMILFSVNFSSYFLLMKGRIKDALNTEVRVFFIVLFAIITTIALNLYFSGTMEDISEAFLHSSFMAGAIVSTTGYATVEILAWPEFSKLLLLFLMLMGACAGSTGGGIKVSRILMLAKGMLRELKMLVHPRQVKKITLDGAPVEHEVVRTVNAYIVTYFSVFILSMVLLSVCTVGGEQITFETNFTTTLTTLNNVGPALGQVGSTGNFASFSIMAKIVYMFNMLIGRLELFPFLVLLTPATYKK